MTAARLISLLALALVNPAAYAERPQPSKDWASISQCPLKSAIRVSLKDGGSVRGLYVGVSADALLVQTAKGERALARQGIERVQLKGSGRRGRHVLIGAAAGAGGGLIGVGALHDAKACNTGFCVGPDVGHYVKLAITPVGAVLGAIIGALLPAGGWTELYRAP